MDATSPTLCTNSAEVSNSSNLVTSQKDEELLSILEEGLQHNEMPENINVSNRIRRIFLLVYSF